MLFILQIVTAQIAIVRLYGKIVSSPHFKVLCGMMVLPFVAMFLFTQGIACFLVGVALAVVVSPILFVVLAVKEMVQSHPVSVVERPVGEPVPSVEWMLADHSYTIDNMLADGAWQMQKDLVIAQYESFNPFDGMTSLGIPESRFWTNCQPVETILFQEDDLIETSVDIATLPKRELFALAKQHGLKVSGKGRTLDVIRTELFKIMYGK